jgi:DNA mismatch repair protein MutS
MKYGEKTITLMQVGAFYEVYAYSEDGQLKGCNIEEYGKICDLHVSKRKCLFDNKPLFMAGFPDYQIEKYIEKLQQNGYTAAIYNQNKITEKHIERKLAYICSPGTYISDETTTFNTNNISCMRMFVRRRSVLNCVDTMICGISTVNVITGECNYLENKIDRYSHSSTDYDFLERYISITNPSEFIFIYDSTEMDTVCTQHVVQYIGIQNVKTHFVDISKSDTHLTKKAKRLESQYVQNDVLKEYYKPNDIDVFVEQHGFNKYREGCLSFIFLLDFLQEHNANLVHKIQEPTIECMVGHMKLANHSLKQLNIIDNNGYGKKGCLLNMLNNCYTHMGRRYFKDKLLHPIIDELVLNERYLCTNVLKDNIEKLDAEIKLMRTLTDIDREYRRINMLRSDIFNLIKLKHSLVHTKTIFSNETIRNIKSLDCDEVLNKVNDILETLNVLNEYYVQNDDDEKLNDIYFLKDYSSSLTNTYYEWKNNARKIIGLRDFFNSAIESRTKKSSNSTQYCKIHETEKSNMYIKTTNTRSKLLDEFLKAAPEMALKIQYISVDNERTELVTSRKDIQFYSVTSTEKKIVSHLIETVIDDCKITKESFLKSQEIMFKDLLETLSSKRDAFVFISTKMGEFDFYLNNARNAIEYNYVQPTIVPYDDEGDEKSVFIAKSLRHPLVERIQQEETYVANDIEMNDDGMLLYGTNAVGKSSLIKSVGICLIMAQSGMFVPCSSFMFTPYHKLFTRILGNDNIFKGLSTFAVEMSELKVILEEADKRSVILGDELCSGTESGSAISLFTAGICHLINTRSTFIFATHFHEITKLECIQSLDRLYINHLSVYYCQEIIQTKFV